VVVGVLKLTFSIPHASSLKEKRSVVRSLVERARNRFNASVAEVDAQDLLQRAVIGVSVVANDGRFVNSVLDEIRAAMESDALGRAELLDGELELMHCG
jgi:uncharacterized protein YlxP (DUF503 family)